MPSIPDFPYSDVRAKCEACMHAARSLAQADIYTLQWEGRPAVLKDFSKRPWWVRKLWARAVAAREIRALSKMAGVRGVPRIFGTAGSEAFVMELMQAERLPKLESAPPPAAYWADAERLITEMHKRGVAHGDLRRKNLMIDSAGEAVLIDFATAMIRPEAGSAPVANFLFRRCRRIDRITLARIKASYGEHLLTDEDRALIASQPWYLKAGRWIKKNVYRWRKPRTWRKKVGRFGSKRAE